jgi:DNA-binding MarR family transcriptional regulator
VVFAGPIAVRDLAEAEQVRSPTMTRLVDGLQRDGLVTREPNPDDARSVLIRATASGRLVLSRGRSRRVEDLATRLAGLDPAGLRTLDDAAGLIEGIARDRPPAP